MGVFIGQSLLRDLEFQGARHGNDSEMMGDLGFEVRFHLLRTPCADSGMSIPSSLLYLASLQPKMVRNPKPSDTMDQNLVLKPGPESDSRAFTG
jgi:hypothetical protein